MGEPRKGDVLGVSIDVLDYDGAADRILSLATGRRPACVCAANTHLVGEAHRKASFANVLKRFDLVLPDGMPLVWCLNLRGADLKDRVYGPMMMHRVLVASPGQSKHFFFGGSEECLQALVRAAQELNPGIRIAGTLSPPYRPWTEADQTAFASAIQANEPDFIWVALGGIKQETWIVENLHRFQHGVFLAVGDAFELLAGRRRMAPMWMQRSGLGWVFRLCQDPRRLWKRYLVYNTLFTVALLCHALGFRRANAVDAQRKEEQSGPNV